MNKRMVWLGIISILLLSTVSGTIWSGEFQTPASSSRIWTVDDDGPADYSSIQEAIDSASPGDIIHVYNGTYYEAIIIDKSLDLIGVDGSDITVIDALQVDTDVVVTIESSNVRIEDFTIRNAPQIVTYGIKIIQANRTVIHGNKIMGVDYGIYLEAAPTAVYSLNDAEITGNNINAAFGGIYASNATNLLISKNTFDLGGQAIGLDFVQYCIVSENRLLNYMIGIRVNGNFNNISNNTITNLDHYCIYVYGSSNNVINNTIAGGDSGIRCGKYGLWEGSNTIADNMITDISGWGIHLEGSSDNVTDNVFRDCLEGVVLGSNSSTINSNTFFSCLRGVHISNGTHNNVIRHNNFLNSTPSDNSEEFVNLWDKNYWGDYEGKDLDGDGFGDAPYIIYNAYENVTTNRDSYPLDVPWGLIPVFWKDVRHDCSFLGNTTLTMSMLDFNHSSKSIGFNISLATKTGNCTITIPMQLLRGIFKVLVDNNPIAHMPTWNETHTSIYFEVPIPPFGENSIHNVRVVADVVTPLIGDINNDCAVDIFDAVILAINFGEKCEG